MYRRSMPEPAAGAEAEDQMNRAYTNIDQPPTPPILPDNSTPTLDRATSAAVTKAASPSGAVARVVAALSPKNSPPSQFSPRKKAEEPQPWVPYLRPEVAAPEPIAPPSRPSSPPGAKLPRFATQELPKSSLAPSAENFPSFSAIGSASVQQISPDAKKKATPKIPARILEAPTEDAVVTIDESHPFIEGTVDRTVLLHWYRRCLRKYRDGVTVIKVNSAGKLVRRKLFVGAEPEYMELTSSKLLDLSYHLDEIQSLSMGTNSPEFIQLAITQPEHVPKKTKSLVIKVPDCTVSLVFRTESDRRDAQFILRVQSRAVKERWEALRAVFDARKIEAGLDEQV